MEKLNVCHIVNWYPNRWNEKEALWTQRHVKSLEHHVENTVYHVQVRGGKWKLHTYDLSNNEHAFVLTTNTQIWFLKEILTTLLLIYVLMFKIRKKRFDVFNFHITYPLLTYSRLITWICKAPVVVTEHWSAYHYNFGVTKRLKRIERIFKNKKLKFICVSEALIHDIEKFSRQKINSSVVPNVIDVDTFNLTNSARIKNQIFMVSYWKYPKDPILIFQVVKELQKDIPDLKLVVGGFGPLQNDMEKWVEYENLEDVIIFRGKLNSDEIAKEFNMANLFVHCSYYEVASVVTMEATSCGCPVVASKVGGIVEYIDDSNGVLVEEHTKENWGIAIKKALGIEYSYKMIESQGRDRFDEKSVAESYYQVLLDSYKHK